MKKGLVGKKLGMTQLIEKTGEVLPVTVVLAKPCFVFVWHLQSSPQHLAIDN